MHTTDRSVPLGTPVTISDVLEYRGCTGRLIGRTSLLPSWFVVLLDDGRRVVVRPGHLSFPKEQGT